MTMDGKVIAIEKNQVVIELKQETKSCEVCTLKHSCSLPDKKTIGVSKSDLDYCFSVGEEVLIESLPGKITVLAFVVYIVPLIIMAVFGFAGLFFSENMSILFGIFGLLCGLFILYVTNKRISHKRFVKISKKDKEVVDGSNCGNCD
jgi:positive regulator of sigma E activity